MAFNWPYGSFRTRSATVAGRARTVITGRFEAAGRARADKEIEVAVDTRKLHFFDLDTGLGIYG